MFKLVSSQCLILIFCTGCMTTSKQDTVILSHVLADRISRNLIIEEIRIIDSGGQLLTIQATLRNNKTSPYDFKYLFEWFDDQGLQVYAPASSWVRRTIQGKQILNFTGIAPSEKARDWRLQIQPWDK